IYSKLTELDMQDPNLHVLTNLTGVSNMEVNAFQRRSKAVIQKSIREGFGLVISEALWKGTPVVARRAGGIPIQLDDGGGFLERLIEDKLSGPGFDVRIRGFEGALSSRATVAELVLSDEEGAWMTLTDAVLDWNRSALLRGRLEVEELSAASVPLPRLPKAQASAPAPEATPFSLPDLPVSIEIGKLAIERVELGAPILGEPAVVSLSGSASLADGEGEVAIKGARIDGELGELTLAGSYANDDKALTLDLSLTEGAGGIVANLIDLPGRPSLSASVQGSGPLSDFTAEIELTTDGEPRIAGTVALRGEGENGEARRFSVDLGGDIAPVFSPTYRPFFGPDIRLEAQGAQFPDGRVVLDDFSLAAQSLTLTGKLALGADKVPELIALKGEIRGQDGPVLLPFGEGDTRVESIGLDVAFDAAQGDEWTGIVTVSNLQQADLEVAEIRLDGQGRIADMEDGLSVTAGFDFLTRGMSLDDGGLQQALGDSTTGRAVIAWSTGNPVELQELELAGATYRLDGTGRIDPTTDNIPVTLNARIEAQDLAPFSGLAGRPLSGGLSAELTAEALALTGGFDVALDGSAEDLKLGIAELDGVLAGQTALVLRADRDETGTRLSELTLRNPQLDLEAQADLKTGTSDARATLKIADLSRVDRAL
ncbi:hypothetical protein LCGC14_2144300, partial [marine sediment metagenome]